MPRIIHFEIVADDVARATKFFSNVFGWQFQGWGDGSYQLAKTGPDGEAGIDGAVTKRSSPQQQVVANAINVPSVDDYCAKVVANGGKITQAKAPVTGMGWVAYFTDTEGNTHSLWQTDPNAK